MTKQGFKYQSVPVLTSMEILYIFVNFQHRFVRVSYLTLPDMPICVVGGALHVIAYMALLDLEITSIIRYNYETEEKLFIGSKRIIKWRSVAGVLCDSRVPLKLWEKFYKMFMQNNVTKN